MTQRQWLARERAPDMCGINARWYLRQQYVANSAAIHRKVALNAIGSAARRLAAALSELRGTEKQ